MVVDRVGTHLSHCCFRHRCKYGYGELCPVENGSLPQDDLCEMCVDPDEARADINDILAEVEFSESILAKGNRNG